MLKERLEIRPLCCLSMQARTSNLSSLVKESISRRKPPRTVRISQTQKFVSKNLNFQLKVVTFIARTRPMNKFDSPWLLTRDRITLRRMRMTMIIKLVTALREGCLLGMIKYIILSFISRWIRSCIQITLIPKKQPILAWHQVKLNRNGLLKS